MPASTLRRFWTRLSHYHGQLMNYAELARSFGVSDMVVRRYVDILEGTLPAGEVLAGSMEPAAGG